MIKNPSNTFFQKCTLMVYNRTVRKIVASTLLLLSVLCFGKASCTPRCAVYSAHHQITPGIPINSHDTVIEHIPRQYCPLGAITAPFPLVGKYVALPIGTGEIIKKTNLLDYIDARSYLPSYLNPRIVPVSLGDSALLLSTHAGQVVDIITTEKTRNNSFTHTSQESRTHIIAHGIIVISTINKGRNTNLEHGVILFAVPYADVEKVAALANKNFSVIYH